jgi:hypothetical protein
MIGEAALGSPRPTWMRISLQAEKQRRPIRWPKRTASRSLGQSPVPPRRMPQALRPVENFVTSPGNGVILAA